MNQNAQYAATLLRLALGVMFIAHGLLKAVVFGMPGAVGFFESVGFPGALAYVVTIAEIGGGVLLLAGIAVRAVALSLIPILAGAMYVHFGFGWVFSNENGGWEYPAFLIVASVVSALLGPGRFALSLPLAKRPQATNAEPA